MSLWEIDLLGSCAPHSIRKQDARATSEIVSTRSKINKKLPALRDWNVKPF